LLKIQHFQGQDRMNSMRPTRLTTLFSGSAAFGLALGAAVLAAPAPARAGDDDVPIDTKIIRGLLEGLGLQRDGKASINYQERAPLVIPPNSDLPPPEKSDALVANNPAWPKDPDVARRQEEIRAEHERSKVSAGDQVENDQRVLRPDELNPGKPPRRGASGIRLGNSLGEDGARMSPSQLGYKGGLFSNMFGSKDDESVSFTSEPPRVSLTDPPPGYQTPSPDQPYGAGKGPPPKAEDYKTTHGEMQR
jgi:hypothetical protein